MEHAPKGTVEVKPSPRGPEVSPEHPVTPGEYHPKRSKGVRILTWLLVLGGFAVLIWYVVNRKPQIQAPAGRRGGAAAGGAPVTITAATATQGDLGVYIDAIGTVTPVYTDTITSQSTGLITAVNYREGQLVHKGQLLIQIDPRPYEAQVHTAEGTLEHDTGLLKGAQVDLKRYQDAWARNAISKQMLDDQVALVEQYQGSVLADQGTLAYDKVQLSYCTITAPISGRVGLRLVDPGNLVTANAVTPLAVVTQLQPITVIFVIAEDSVPQVAEQMHAGAAALSVEAWDRAMQHKLAEGRLLTTDNQIDTVTGTLKLRAVFANEKNALFPNQFVNARLLVKTLHGVTRIPSSAIQRNGDVSYVYVVKDGRAKMQSITPGVSDSGVTEVTGINPGDVVANSNFEKITNGSKVMILSPNATTEGLGASGSPAGNARGGHAHKMGGKNMPPQGNPAP